ncbi:MULTISPECIES: hypothetical protein [unclassified Agromyces]|uniref:hypothetical protein n=1 Tax=unclassified Agromyces TaxID=2639701 RepID=UPI0007B20F9A|nr:MULTISPECIES: hypothetical protein [unclassified Agromyces]KZE92941.1 hypothetical protein AVP42_02013 [Agromyces sp. NDB4Y10]MCK8609955.1 hypothetical protein [Agromyces sp. C10]
MERIHYAGGVLLTGSDIAGAVVDYAAALAARRTAASVDIPVRVADGRTSRAHMLIGPSSQLVTEPIESDLDELVDEDLVTALRIATTALETTRPVIGATGPDDLIDDGDTDALDWPPIT